MQKNDSDNFKRYQNATLQIRELSSPRVDEVESEDQYYGLLMKNFARIGELSVCNQKILEEHLYPLLEEEHVLSESERESLWEIASLLLDSYKMENINVQLRYKIIHKLLVDAEVQADERRMLLTLDAMVETVFVLMHNASRLSPSAGLSYAYREEGLHYAKRLLDYLQEDRFAALPNEECKHLVLVNARYISALFDRSDAYGDEANRADFAMMKKALALKDNPFYREQAPHYNWDLHTFRTLQYITNFTETCNIRGFSPAELKEIQDYTRQLLELYNEKEEALSKTCPRDMVDLYCHRIDYLCGELDIEDYKARLFSIVTSADQEDHSLHMNATFMVTFSEILQVIKESGFTGRDKARCAYIYQSIISYMHHVPKMRSFSFLMTFLSEILKSYLEIGGREREYENFCLELAAALHPPTYVHMLTVAELSKAIARHLYLEAPERFLGFLGCETVEEVREKAVEILDFAYHAALCHDFGKLFITEVIITYDRNLLKEEFDLIKAHPLIGAYILEQHKDTEAYANVARYHHRWYDNSEGYPAKSETPLPEQVIIDIVRCADCLDASTDAVGRSYKKGLTLSEALAEMEEGRDSAYAGYLLDIIGEAQVKEDITVILHKKRAEHYYRAYQTLSNAQEL